MFFVVSMVGVFADEVKTNVEGLVVKGLSCSGFVSAVYSGNAVNRSSKHLVGQIYAYSYDKDGDPIGQCSGYISLMPKTGDKWNAPYCNCRGSKTVKLIFKESK